MGKIKWSNVRLPLIMKQLMLRLQYISRASILSLVLILFPFVKGK